MAVGAGVGVPLGLLLVLNSGLLWFQIRKRKPLERMLWERNSLAEPGKVEMSTEHKQPAVVYQEMGSRKYRELGGQTVAQLGPR